MSEPRDIYDWDRRYGGTILPPIPPRSRRRYHLARRWAAFIAGAVALVVFATLMGVSR